MGGRKSGRERETEGEGERGDEGVGGWRAARQVALAAAHFLHSQLINSSMSCETHSALFVCRQVALAAAHIHAHGFIHRDINRRIIKIQQYLYI